MKHCRKCDAKNIPDEWQTDICITCGTLEFIDNNKELFERLAKL